VFDDATNETGENSVFGDSGTTVPDAESDTDGTTQTGPDQRTNDARTRSSGTARNATRASSSDATQDSTSGQRDQSTDDPDVDPRTYNKVVRLLKNRDLPVPRDEIEAIAGSAYDIPDHECEAILDATIERGLVAEANGQLTHPDGV